MRSLGVVVLFAALCAGMLLLPAMRQDPSKVQDTAMQEALAARAVAAKQVMDYAALVAESGRDAFEDDSPLARRILWSRRAAVAAAEAGTTTLREALSQHLAEAERLMALKEELYQAGRQALFDLQMGRYEVADTKVQLARAGK